MRSMLLILAICSFLSGCGTLSDAMCGPIGDHVFYRGVRLDVKAVKEGGPMVFMAADIPFSVVADTFLVPYIAYHELADRPRRSVQAGNEERKKADQSRIANDPSAHRAARASAVFELFRRHLKLGDDPSHVPWTLTDPNWLSGAKLYYFAILGGWIPVDMNPDDRTYSLHLFADKEGQSEWVIFFQLAGRSAFGQEHEDGLAFLHGKANPTRPTTLKEFALCYPDGRIEVVTPEGVRHIKIR